ncbi:MAG TPA: septum site-determining protein MinC, partial [Dehalococcoidia bacterium]|nr:septum site-determining protein MinC [Dehalococcoidia bacterium]
ELAPQPPIHRVRPVHVRPFDPKEEMVGLYRGNEALLIKTTCRSGEVIRYPGDVVVLADVNPGAEIIADGDILVFGNLRGLAHAGAGGDIQATIIALSLDTHRLQIGPFTGVAPKSNKRSKSNTSNPRIALVRRRSIYVAAFVGRFAGYSGGTLYDG